MVRIEVSTDLKALEKLIARAEEVGPVQAMQEAQEEAEAHEALPSCARCGAKIEADDQRCRGMGQQPKCAP